MIKIKSSSLERVSSCPICKSNAYDVVLEKVTDNVSYAAEYSANVLACRECNHSFLSPVINSSELHLAYQGYYTQSTANIEIASNSSVDSFSKFIEFYEYNYKDRSSSNGKFIYWISYLLPFARFFLKRAVRFLPEPLKNDRPKLLDVGCGRGDFLIRAQHCGYDATGIDFDSETIDIANSRGVSAVVAEIHDLPLDVQYDAIVLSHVVEHVSDPVRLLDDIFKRLKPGGYFYISTPNIDSAGRLTFGKSWRGLDFPRHLQYFNVINLKILLNRSGFESIKQVYDLPQSVGIVRSSFKLRYPDGITPSNFLSSLYLLLRNKAFAPSKLDVAVFRCYKNN
ncbi:class I SAM-dependent methyltransferase [Porticoccaceae bacterium]|nr:class I SAM-dependent methyltransferase [Porticoccaceae bacterium]